MPRLAGSPPCVAPAAPPLFGPQHAAEKRKFRRAESPPCSFWCIFLSIRSYSLRWCSGGGPEGALRALGVGCGATREWRAANESKGQVCRGLVSWWDQKQLLGLPCKGKRARAAHCAAAAAAEHSAGRIRRDNRRDAPAQPPRVKAGVSTGWAGQWRELALAERVEETRTSMGAAPPGAAQDA